MAIHREQLVQHGGANGMRDEALLDSALAKAHNVFAYAAQPDIFRIAAAYAFGIVRNLAFIDSNIRTSLVVSLAFLVRNGWDIVASKEDTYFTFLHLAEGSLTEDDLAIWFAKHAVRLTP